MEKDNLDKSIEQIRGKANHFPVIKVYKDSKFKKLRYTNICAFSTRTKFVSDYVKERFKKRFEKNEVLKFIKKDFLFKN